MIELVRTNDVVHLSWCQAVLKGEGIDSVVVDLHTSAIEGSIGAIPRRLLVAEEQEARARRLLEDARREVERGGD